MTTAEILQQAGFAPTVPTPPQTMETPQSMARGHVPTVPSVPAQDDEDIAAADAIRAYLMALATAESIELAHVHRLHDLDVAAYIGLDAYQLAAYLFMLADTAGRHVGRVPLDDTAAMHCEQCGPVWIHPDVAAVLPVVDGWPRALGCPWCFVRKAGGTIPRPSLTGASVGV